MLRIRRALPVQASIDGRSMSRDSRSQPDSQPEVTQLLHRIVDGSDSAGERLLPLIYEEMRDIAANAMRGERADHTLQPTALVHEAYINLVGSDVQWQGRRHFLAVAARAMRRLLINHARDRRAAKRGGGQWARITLDEALSDVEERIIDVIALDEAMEKLSRASERQAAIVELRFFGGLTMSEAAATLGITTDVARGDWAIARAWLTRELRRGQDG